MIITISYSYIWQEIFKEENFRGSVEREHFAEYSPDCIFKSVACLKFVEKTLAVGCKFRKFYSLESFPPHDMYYPGIKYYWGVISTLSV